MNRHRILHRKSRIDRHQWAQLAEYCLPLVALGTGPQTPRPTRGRSADRTQGGAPPPPQGDSDGDSSSYGSDVRTHQNPVAQEPRIPVSQRPEGPIPPSFHEDLFMAAFQMGAAVQAQQAQFLAQAGGFNMGTPPPAPNQPQGEPDPEQPGAGEPPSEQDTTTGAETIDDDSDAETLRVNEGEDRSDYPENTDSDPYEDAENPTGSQAEAEQAPDIQQIEIDDSHDEEGESDLKSFLSNHLRVMGLRRLQLKRLQEYQQNQP